MQQFDLPGPTAPRLAKAVQPEFPDLPELPALPVDPSTYSCDAVIACCAADIPYLQAAVTSLVTQRFVKVQVHVVCDGFKPSQIVRRDLARYKNVRLYWHQASVGPYLSAMRVVPFMKTKSFAVQDADDVSMPYRLWRSCQVLEEAGAALVGGACVQSLAPGEHRACVTHAAKFETYRFSGQVWDTAPLGMSLHPASMFLLSAFRAVNGYGDYLSAGDCEINTRLRVAKYKVVNDNVLYTIRQLRSDSLSHGYERLRTTGYEAWLEKELASRYSEFALEVNLGNFKPANYGVLDREVDSKQTFYLL